MCVGCVCTYMWGSVYVQMCMWGKCVYANMHVGSVRVCVCAHVHAGECVCIHVGESVCTHMCDGSVCTHVHVGGSGSMCVYSSAQVCLRMNVCTCVGGLCVYMCMCESCRLCIQVYVYARVHKCL